MRKSIGLMAVGLLALSGGTLGFAAACGTSKNSGTGGKTPKVGVILPDSASSARWETADRPYLSQAFQAAGAQHDIQQEADAGAAIAVAMAKGETPSIGQSVKDPKTGKAVPARLLTPQSITKTNVKTVVDDGFVKKADLCTAAFASACAAAGI